MRNLFDREDCEVTIGRINQLSKKSQPQWGKMSADKMLAHCNVMFDMTFTDKYPKFSFAKVLLLKLLIKKSVVGPNPYPKNGRTAPDFIISDTRVFEDERAKLIQYLKEVQELGAVFFEDKFYRSFGKLSSQEWNMMFYKHLDHHLRQFGV